MDEEKNGTTETEPISDSDRNQIVFHYVKSKHARTIHVDGVFGGTAPKGDGLTIGVFSERSPYPDSSVYVADPTTGRLEEDRKQRKITRQGVIREIEVTLVISLANAVELRNWLDEHIGNLKVAQSIRERQTTELSNER